GFVEGNEIFSGKVDVIVCDGFVGNVMIKSSAGVVRVVEDAMRECANRNWLSRFRAWLSAALLSDLREQINPAKFNGASLLGLQGIIVKSHGNAQADGFFHAI